MSEKKVHPGTRRAAILLMSLQEDQAANVMRSLPKDVLAAVSLEMSRTTEISNAEMKQILEMFMNELSENHSVGMESTDQLRNTLISAVGADKAEAILEGIMTENQNEFSIEKLNQMDANSVADMIREEHPQIITAILVNLERDVSGAILSALDENLRNDVLHRIATFTGVQREALQDLTEVLSHMLDGQNMKRSTLGGVRTAAEILNTMPSSNEESALAAIRTINEDLAQRIQDEMFVFENIIGIDEAGIQLIISQVEQNSLVVALKGANQEMVNKFANAMSSRGAEMFLEDLQNQGPLRVSQVEAEQKNILAVVRQLVQNGEIELSGADDDYVA